MAYDKTDLHVYCDDLRRTADLIEAKLNRNRPHKGALHLATGRGTAAPLAIRLDGSSDDLGNWPAPVRTGHDRAVMAKRKNEAAGDAAPRLPISVCINVEGNKLTAVRVSPEAAAKISRVKGFPHYDLSPEEKRDELRKLLDYDHSRLIGRGIVEQRTHFNPLASTYFPHMWAVPAGGKRTPHKLFHDSEKLPWAMGKRNKLRDRSKRELKEESDLPNISGDYLPPSVLTKSSVQKALRTFSGTQGVSNFSPVQASAIYDKFLPKKGGAVFDPSCGWGGRLLGAIACKKVLKYIGCDPGTETFKGLEQMRDELLPIARSKHRNLKVELHMLGSETKEMRKKLKPNSVDLIFSSPPYYAQETYSNEPTQSWVKYPDQESWLDGFIGGTLDNCAYCLRPGGYLVINIADVSSYKGSLEGDFIVLAKSKGWKLVKTLKLRLSSMMGGTKHKSCQKCQMLTGKEHGTKPVDPAFTGKWKKCDEHKYTHEPIFVFRKK
jgi:hypothetical protein